MAIRRVNAAARHRVVIVGAGFGGLATATKLGGSDVDVVLIDRSNHHLFQPLLYQVATAALSPADIAEPIRKIVRRFKNITVLMDEVTGADTTGRWITLARGTRVAYDALVVATGSQYAYFGHDDWAAFAPGLKSIENARSIRGKLLQCFERAELTERDPERAALLTCVVVGGGPTGVELSGAIAELSRWTLRNEFRRIDPTQMRVLLVEGGDRILSQFPKELSDYAERELRQLGVEVLVGQRVSNITDGGAVINGTLVHAKTCVWAAGVKATSAAAWLGVSPADRMGRIAVDDRLRVHGCERVYALGDLALLMQDGEALPGLAQVAKQQGEYLGRALRTGDDMQVPPFRFRNRGNTAVIGRHAAVFDFGSWQLKGGLAWLLWAVVHVYLLVSFEKRVLVSVQWLWRYLTRARGARLIP